MNNFINNALSNKTAQVITSQYNNEIAILKNLQKMKTAMQHKYEIPFSNKIIAMQPQSPREDYDILTQNLSGQISPEA